MQHTTSPSSFPPFLFPYSLSYLLLLLASLLDRYQCCNTRSNQIDRSYGHIPVSKKGHALLWFENGAGRMGEYERRRRSLAPLYHISRSVFVCVLFMPIDTYQSQSLNKLDPRSAALSVGIEEVSYSNYRGGVYEHAGGGKGVLRDGRKSIGKGPQSSQ